MRSQRGVRARLAAKRLAAVLRDVGACLLLGQELRKGVVYQKVGQREGAADGDATLADARRDAAFSPLAEARTAVQRGGGWAGVCRVGLGCAGGRKNSGATGGGRVAERVSAWRKRVSVCAE